MTRMEIIRLAVYGELAIFGSYALVVAHTMWFSWKTYRS